MERFRERLEREAGRWVGDGIVSGEQAERILSLYPKYAVTDEPGWAANLLHAAAGILIGAAALALVFVGLEPTDPTLVLVGIGVALAVAGFAFIQFSLDKDLVGDALLVASLVPMVPAGMDSALAGLLTGGFALGYLFWRHERVFVQVASVIAFTAAVPMTLMNFQDVPYEAIWLLAQVGLLVALVVVDQMMRQEEGIVPVALAVIALVIPMTLWLEELIQSATLMEVLIGVVAAGLIAIGVKAGHRGVVTGAVLVLAGDAIVFGFEVGNVVLGIIVLLAVAVVLLWQGERVREFFSE